MAVSTGYIGLFLEDHGEENQRTFDPRDSRAHRHVPVDQLIVYNAHKGVRQLQEMNAYTGQMSVDSRTVVVSIDGACRGNGTPSAQAAWGVYFGPQSMHNECGLLDATLPQTSTRAEIEALSQALNIIRNYVSEDYSLLHYHIRTDSSYLVNTFSTWIHDWIKNGGMNSRGKRAAHFEVLKRIEERLDDMTYGDDGGMTFRFWLVPRGENKEADALANQALDEGSRANILATSAKLQVLAISPLDQASGSNKMAANVKPRVLAVSLNRLSFFDSMYDSLLSKLRADSTFQRVEDGPSAIRMLLEEPRPDAVLVTDEALTLKKNAAVWDAVLKYIRRGGTAVCMGHFSCFTSPMSIKPFFAKAGLDWSSASYHRTTLVLNAQAVGTSLASRLPPAYSQKAVFLKQAKPSDAWYVTNKDSVLESLVFGAENAHTPGESPVLLARVAGGKLGYVGDVNGEEGSEAVVLAMCGL
ncbi:ribonuclease H-like protein [Trichoderma longibrachiatum]|uniref:ribonuclease H n=1 Tax=Trichoderma longibrachiatum ATCC 18648 TaxID=983965 RepID=A0A2T4BUR5_TRILO|nr:ribonuclease H-like protein [Trichoderma longibrachiatum ATCC 18648]